MTNEVPLPNDDDTVSRFIAGIDPLVGIPPRVVWVDRVAKAAIDRSPSYGMNIEQALAALLAGHSFHMRQDCGCGDDGEHKTMVAAIDDDRHVLIVHEPVDGIILISGHSVDTPIIPGQSIDRNSVQPSGGEDATALLKGAFAALEAAGYVDMIRVLTDQSTRQTDAAPQWLD